MKVSNILLLSLVSCLLSFSTGCNYSKEYQTIDAGKFTMSVPSWLKKDEKLKPGAELEYANHFRNFYIIGEAIDKSKAGKDFAATINDKLNIIRNALKEPVVSDSTAVTIGGLPGERMEVFGKMGGENIYYSEVLLEGKTNFYHFSIWTRGEGRKLRYKDEISKILNSFMEKG